MHHAASDIHKVIFRNGYVIDDTMKISLLQRSFNNCSMTRFVLGIHPTFTWLLYEIPGLAFSIGQLQLLLCIGIGWMNLKADILCTGIKSDDQRKFLTIFKTKDSRILLDCPAKGCFLLFIINFTVDSIDSTQCIHTANRLSSTISLIGMQTCISPEGFHCNGTYNIHNKNLLTFPYLQRL